MTELQLLVTVAIGASALMTGFLTWTGWTSPSRRDRRSEITGWAVLSLVLQIAIIALVWAKGYVWPMWGFLFAIVAADVQLRRVLLRRTASTDAAPAG